jgi:uncharacterized protein (UPF0335 family)
MRLAEEAAIAQQGMKDILLEMKAAGIDTQMYKKAMKIREVGIDVHAEEESILHQYLHAMGVTQPPEQDLTYY